MYKARILILIQFGSILVKVLTRVAIRYAAYRAARSTRNRTLLSDKSPEVGYIALARVSVPLYKLPIVHCIHTPLDVFVQSSLFRRKWNIYIYIWPLSSSALRDRYIMDATLAISIIRFGLIELTGLHKPSLLWNTAQVEPIKAIVPSVRDTQSH